MNKPNKFFRFCILLIIFINTINLKSQINCEITIDEWVEMPVCYDEQITFKV